MNILLLRAKPTFMDMILGIPIGLSMIAAMAEQQGHRPVILDLALENTQDEALTLLRDRLQRESFDVAGISCMTVEYEASCVAARVIREVQPHCRIVFGGQHPTIQPQQVAAEPFCDAIVSGEGEATFAAYLGALESGQPLENVSGLVLRRGEQLLHTAPRTPISDLDALPWPAYHLLDIDRYSRLASARYTPKHKRAMQIFTSRGCPWRCTYCHDLFGKKFRARSAANVFGEIKLLHDRYGIREFMVEDDIFNLDMQRAKDLCDLIIDSGMRIFLQFGNGLRLERFDEELVQKLARAGTHHIALAIESASPRIQKLIKKNLKLERTQEVVGWMRKYGIRTLGFFMIGFPDETPQEIEDTIRFARSTDLDEALFSIVIPYAGTELNREVQSSGLYDPEQVSAGGNGIRLLRSRHCDFPTLKKLQRKAYLAFFLSRGRALRMIPRLLHPRSTRKYLNAIERNFLSYGGNGSSRIN